MTLIKSISGIRGTIGGAPTDNLTPVDIVKFASAYGSWILSKGENKTIVIGRDARISGSMVSELIIQTLIGLGLDVVDLGLSTTPTVEMAVPAENAAGGIIVTASHNPKQWNALKLLNEVGEFISAAEGQKILEIAEAGEFHFAPVDQLGKRSSKDYLDYHIEQILALDLVKPELIKKANYKIAVDPVNSVGGIAVPRLLNALGVDDVVIINGEPTGVFAHNPEPLAEHLGEISSTVKSEKCHLGIVIDPDVDRLAFVCDDGEMFGEEYTLVAVADFVLSHKPGATVSNLSSTRALRDITEKVGQSYFASAVGEVNVVEVMKANNAVIGGEGNGGVIVPELHYGRDALVGIALFLTHLAEKGVKISNLRSTYPTYQMSKNKAELTAGTDVDMILEKISEKYKKQPQNTIDGVKIEFDGDWVHLRKSNTEPIIRIYAESASITTAENLTKKILQDIGEIIE
ncbi:MAG: phosphoglucosamine mutase [Bacteroidia bacterium]|nr:phosphoglucosamine mutase [Bacteroidia bacterium]